MYIFLGWLTMLISALNMLVSGLSVFLEEEARDRVVKAISLILSSAMTYFAFATLFR